MLLFWDTVYVHIFMKSISYFYIKPELQWSSVHSTHSVQQRNPYLSVCHMRFIYSSVKDWREQMVSRVCLRSIGDGRWLVLSRLSSVRSCQCRRGGQLSVTWPDDWQPVRGRWDAGRRADTDRTVAYLQSAIVAGARGLGSENAEDLLVMNA